MITTGKPISIAFEYDNEKISKISIMANNSEGQELLKEFWETEDGDLGVFGNDPNTILMTTHTGKEFIQTITPQERESIEKFFGGISFMEAVTKNVEYSFNEKESHDFYILKRQ
jgi:hypothetical protein